GCVSYAELNTQVVGREIAASAEHVAALANAIGVQVDGRADSIARALGSADQLQLNPVVTIRIHVAQQYRHAVHIVEDNVDFAVIEQVAERCSTPDADNGKPSSLHRRHQVELAILQIVKKQRALGITGSPIWMLVHAGIDMTVDDQQIFPAVIVVIEKAIAKADKWNCGRGDASFVTDVGEIAGAVVAEDHIVIVAEVGVDDIQMPIVFVVSGGNAHVRDLASIGIQRVAALETFVGKCSIPFIDVEIIRRGVVGNQKIGLAVIVYIREQRPQAVVSGWIADSELLADIGKGAVSIVME